MGIAILGSSFIMATTYAEEIKHRDEIVIVIGKNGGEPDIEIAQNISRGLLDSGFHNVYIRTDESIVEFEKNNSHLIVIGGPGINKITRELLPNQELQFKKQHQLKTNDIKQYLKWTIVNTQQEDKRYGEITSHNFGLGFISGYVTEKNQHVFFIAGVEAKGTKAASEYFFGQRCDDNTSQDMRFVIVNKDDDSSSNQKECAEMIDSQYGESKEKIFTASESDASEKDLDVTKKIKHDGTDKTTFYPGDKVEIEITLKNNGSEPIDFFFNETLNVFLRDVSSEDCTQNGLQLHCSGTIDQLEQETINYTGTVSSSELGNLILERTQIQYGDTDGLVSQTNLAQNNMDNVIRIHDPIHGFSSITLDKNSLKPGEVTTVNFKLENKGIQFFYANSTVVIDGALEFTDGNANGNSMNHVFGNIHPGDTEEFSIKLQAREDNQILIPTKQTIEFDSLIFNSVYDGTDWKFVYVDPPVNTKAEISVEPLFGNTLLPLIENWPYLIIIVMVTILLVQLKRHSFPFKTYKTSVSKF